MTTRRVTLLGSLVTVAIVAGPIGAGRMDFNPEAVELISGRT